MSVQCILYHHRWIRGTKVNRFHIVYPGQRLRRLKIYHHRLLYCLSDLTAIMSNTQTDLENSPFQGSLTRDIGPQLIIFQLNVEGLSRDKSSYLARLLRELKVDVVLLQETHVPDEKQMHCRGNIDGYKLISATYHKYYGVATYIRNDISNSSHLYTQMDGPVSVIAVNVAGITILNIYKPPNEKWPLPTLLPT